MHDLPHTSAAMSVQCWYLEGTQEEGNLAVKTKTSPKPDQQPRSEQPNLTQRYGKIGIPALKAALRYATPAKNLVSSSVAFRFNERFIERAA